jgi:hypothetical protein
MSFLTSRAPALRTKRPRCPATSGLCSLRRSVPDSSQCARGPILSWDFVLFGNSSPAVSASGPAPAPTRHVEYEVREDFAPRRPRPRQQEEYRIPWVRPATEERSPRPVPGFSRRQQCLVRLLRLQVSRLACVLDPGCAPRKIGNPKEPGSRAPENPSSTFARYEAPPAAAISSHRFVKENL